MGIPVSLNISRLVRTYRTTSTSINAKGKLLFHLVASCGRQSGCNRASSRAAAASWMHLSQRALLGFPLIQAFRQLMKARAALNSASGIAFNMCLRADCDKLPPHAATVTRDERDERWMFSRG